MSELQQQNIGCRRCGEISTHPDHYNRQLFAYHDYLPQPATLAKNDTTLNKTGLAP